jgi:hypothetical protein
VLSEDTPVSTRLFEEIDFVKMAMHFGCLGNYFHTGMVHLNEIILRQAG